MRLAITLASFLALTLTVGAAEQNRRFAIENMTCALCPITVKTAMAAVPGVSAVEVDFGRKEAAVRYDDTVTAPDDIAMASTNAGYPASLILQQP